MSEARVTGRSRRLRLLWANPEPGEWEAGHEGTAAALLRELEPLVLLYGEALPVQLVVRGHRIRAVGLMEPKDPHGPWPAAEIDTAGGMRRTLKRLTEAGCLGFWVGLGPAVELVPVPSPEA